MCLVWNMNMISRCACQRLLDWARDHVGNCPSRMSRTLSCNCFIRSSSTLMYPFLIWPLLLRSLKRMQLGRYVRKMVFCSHVLLNFSSLIPIKTFSISRTRWTSTKFDGDFRQIHTFCASF